VADYSDRIAAQFPPGFTVYRVQDCWRLRRGVVIRGPRRWWMRTWQSEWDGAPRAFRAYTRNGALIRGVRAALNIGDAGAHDATRRRVRQRIRDRAPSSPADMSGMSRPGHHY